MEPGLHKDGSFRFDVPLTLSKSEDGKYHLKGLASTAHRDLHGEQVVTQGIDASYFLKKGYFNWEHQNTPTSYVGVPTKAEHRKDGLWVEGYLLDTPKAKEIVDLAEALQKAGNERGLSFSVEGKTMERDGKVVKKCWLKNVSLTVQPVNSNCYAEIFKSLSERVTQEGYIDESGKEILPTEVQAEDYWTKLGDRIDKSVAGALANYKLTLPTHKEPEDVEKSLEAGTEFPAETGGSALRKQDLDGKVKNLDIPQENEEEKKKKLNKSEATELLVSKGYTKETAKKLADALLDGNFRNFLEQCKPATTN